MNHDEYLALSKARALEAKKMALNALDGQLPAGYILSDDSNQMFGNAMFRIKPERVVVGAKSIHFFHSLKYSSRVVDGSVLITPSTEAMHVSCDVFDGKVWNADVEWGVDGKFKDTLFSQQDLAWAVRESVSKTLTQQPFTEFKWKRDEHDSQKHHLYSGDKKMGSVFKSGDRWGSTSGISSETLGNAKVRTEAVAIGIIKTFHDERLAALGDGVKKSYVGSPPMGWRFIDSRLDDLFNKWGDKPYNAAFEKRLGGGGVPVCDLTILFDGKSYIPAHGLIVMKDRVETAAEAAGIAEGWAIENGWSIDQVNSKVTKMGEKMVSMRDGTAKGLNSDAEIRTMGVALITDVGNENVYLDKDGKSFYFKPANNSRFVIGEHDFSNEVVFGDGVEQESSIRKDETTVPTSNKKALDHSKSAAYHRSLEDSHFKKSQENNSEAHYAASSLHGDAAAVHERASTLLASGHKDAEEISSRGAGITLSAEIASKIANSVGKAADGTFPYDRNDMDAAIEYSRATSQLFFSGYVDEAFAHYMRDPNGGATASFEHTNKEMFVSTMQGMSGGHMASMHLTQGERQAWCESGASHDEIERIATAGGYAAIRVNGTILTRFQDTLGSVMESRIAGVRNELRELGWVGGLGQSLKKTFGDVELQANLVCMSRHVDEKAVGFNFDVMDVVQGNSSHVVVDNDMNKSAKALAQEVDGAFLERKRGEIAESLGFSSVERMNEHHAGVEQGKQQHDADMAYQQSDEARHRKEAASKVFGIPVENIVHVMSLADGQAGVNGVLPELVFEVTFESSGFTNNKEIVGEKLSPSFCGGYTDQANEEGLFPSNIAAVVSGYITDDDHQGESGIRVFASITLLVKAGSEKEAGAIKPPVNLLTTLSDAMSTDFELDGDWEMVNTDVHADLIAVEGKVGIATACPVSSVVLEGTYSGKVTGVDGGVVTQKINREGDVVHHAAARLDKEVKEGDVLDIKYRDGIGAVGGKDNVVAMGR